MTDEAPRSAAFYGRRRGKPLRPGRAGRLAADLPQLALDLSQPAPRDLRALFAAPLTHVALEIGFGGGEHMAALAVADPTLGTIGAEPFVNGMASALSHAAETGIAPRLRLHAADAVPLLDWLPPASLDAVRLLYPDPWPKRRHWKRRFVQGDNLDRIARVLRPGAEFRFASDWADYVDWTLRVALVHPSFCWLATEADDWRQPWQGWPGTRYEAKALAEGRRPAYLRFRRVVGEPAKVEGEAGPTGPAPLRP